MENLILDLLKKSDERLNKIESLLAINKVILNLDDLSTLTGLSKSHIYKLTSSANIPHFKKSKHVFFDREQIELWIKQNPITTIDQIEKSAARYVVLNERGGAK